MSAGERGAAGGRNPETWASWPVCWSAVWVGALSALATAVVFGLIGVAIGAHELGQAGQIARWSQVGVGALAWSVFTAFLAFVIGGWVAGKVAAIERSEPAMLHGAITWALALPLLIALLAIGAGGAVGGWYGGLVGPPAWGPSPAVPADPRVLRNGALAAVTAILLGLVGSVIGAWFASDEPMTLRYYRQRAAAARRAT